MLSKLTQSLNRHTRIHSSGLVVINERHVVTQMEPGEADLTAVSAFLIHFFASTLCRTSFAYTACDIRTGHGPGQGFAAANFSNLLSLCASVTAMSFSFSAQQWPPMPDESPIRAAAAAATAVREELLHLLLPLALSMKLIWRVNICDLL